MGKYGDEKHIFWVNLRQEPVVYVNGKPFTARDPANINFHLEINNPEETSKLEAEFAEEVKKRGEDFKYYKDQFGEHPEERANNEEISEKLSGVTTLNEIYAAIKDKVPKLEPIRIPMNQEMAPAEENFDQIVAMLKDTTRLLPSHLQLPGWHQQNHHCHCVRCPREGAAADQGAGQDEGHRPRRHPRRPQEEEARPSRH